MPAKKKSTPTFLHSLPIEFWRELDLKSKERPSGHAVRLRALEWLRCESLNLAFKHLELSTLKKLQKCQTNDADPALTKELLDIRSGKHHWLIGKGESSGGWIYPYELPSLKNAFAVIRLNEGEEVKDPTRLAVSLNGDLPECVLFAGIHRLLKGHKKALARGDGIPLTRMGEALKMYDLWSSGEKSQQAIGWDAQTLRQQPDDYKGSNDAGRKLILLAQKMLACSKQNPAKWIGTFR